MCIVSWSQSLHLIRIVIYTTTDWWKSCTGNSAAFADNNPLWIARYASSVGDLPAGWKWAKKSNSQKKQVITSSIDTKHSGNTQTMPLRILATQISLTETWPDWRSETLLLSLIFALRLTNLVQDGKRVLILCQYRECLIVLVRRWIGIDRELFLFRSYFHSTPWNG